MVQTDQVKKKQEKQKQKQNKQTKIYAIALSFPLSNIQVTWRLLAIEIIHKCLQEITS